MIITIGPVGNKYGNAGGLLFDKNALVYLSREEKKAIDNGTAAENEGFIIIISARRREFLP